MSLSFRNLAVVLLVLAGVLWWTLEEDSETAVRDAHTELAELIGKAEGEGAPAALLRARGLADLFAAPVEISGAARGLTGAYSPEELGNTIVRVRGVFGRIELSFGELAIDFPSDNDALTEFSAVVIATAGAAGPEEILERRNVTSRMQRIDGDWLFTEFILSATDAE